MMCPGWWGGGLMMVVWVALMVAVVWALIRVGQRDGLLGTRHESALDILKKRYARGEISREEFEERKKDLE